MTNTTPIKFYAAGTANGYKAAIVLEECGFDYTVAPIDLMVGEQFKSEYQSVTRAGRIPSIVVPGDAVSVASAPFSIYGSEPIAIYLAETSGQYLPVTQPDRAKVLEACSVITSDLAAPLSMQFLIELLTDKPQTEVLSICTTLARRFFEVLNDSVAENGFIATRTYSIADMLALPAVHISATRFPAILDNLDALIAWRNRILERPAVQRALAQTLG